MLYSKRPKCPHCGSKIRFFNRIEHCAYSEELICGKCSVSGRFSDSVVDKIPSEFREKFRIYNLLPFIVFSLIGLILIQTAYFRFGGWILSDLGKTLDNIIFLLEMLLIGIFSILLTIKLPHLGTWMFYWWLNSKNNREKMMNAVEAMEKGEYRSENKIYNAKIRLGEFFKQDGLKILYVFTIITNILFIILLFLVRGIISLQGTWFSSFSGYIFVSSIISSFLVISIAAAFYSHKNPENYIQRRNIEILSWFYVLLMPIVYFTFVLSQLGLLNASEELNIPDFPNMLGYFYLGLILQCITICILSYYLMKKANPNFKLQENRKVTRSIDIKYIFSKLPKTLVTLLFFMILVVLLVVCLLMLFIDPTMAFGIILPTYLLMGAIVPIIFTVQKLIPRRPKKYSQLYWTATKISAVILIISIIPPVFTDLGTNISLERQFVSAFGNNYESQIDSDLRAKFRDVPYSAFENYFGFDVSYEGAAYYDVIYCIDNPRFVINHTDGSILSNGSSKYAGKYHNMTMDVYMPQGYDYKDGKEGKFPVIIFCHGVGMEKGTGNANFSISRYFANQGYLVVDAMYGYTGWVRDNDNGRKRGYDFPDTIRHVANITKFLSENSDDWHANVSNTYFAGRSFGGWMATVLAYSAATGNMSSDFAPDTVVRGCFSFYGANGILEAGSELMSNEILGEDGLDVFDLTAPYVRGSDDPLADDFNPDWQYCNPFWLADLEKNSGSSGLTSICPTLFIHGTQDVLVPPGWDIQLQEILHNNDQIGITAFYPMGSHATDVIHWGQYGQSVIYYMERFIGLTRTDL